MCVLGTPYLPLAICCAFVIVDACRGLTEEFTGSVKMFFPLHHEDELDFLKHHWGSYSLICTPFAKGKKAEAAGTDNYFRASMEDRHVSAFYTPIDTIRDYFGEPLDTCMRQK